MAKVGVEQSLTNVMDALRQQGHQVVELNQEVDAQGCECCVVSGLDSNVSGVQTAVTKASVIEAKGLSTDEVCQEVQSRMP
ncbi:YkuS family protein [Bacillus sp. 2205SS5-2]|uniref:YkuS family protein n=1 Tax=Bacillus sp. 2205SS5-2 TaxID=3109031 RepID=UPI0030076971